MNNKEFPCRKTLIAACQGRRWIPVIGNGIITSAQIAPSIGTFHGRECRENSEGVGPTRVSGSHPPEECGTLRVRVSASHGQPGFFGNSQTISTR